jgi:uncharacterized membrane protein YphA (DoxX/SURF4 family)
MRTNPFYDAWLFLTGSTPDHATSGVGPVLVALFLLLLAASAWIAWRNWQEDPGQRTKEHVATWLMRLMIGCMWYQGSLWKLPLPISSGLQYWTEEMSRNAAFEWHKTLVTSVYLPLLQYINPLVYLTELSLAVAFMLGFLVRPLAVIGMVFVVHLWLGLYHHPQEWPWLYVFLIFVQGFFLINNAGRSLGLDATLARAPFAPFAGSNIIARAYRVLA